MTRPSRTACSTTAFSVADTMAGHDEVHAFRGAQHRLRGPVVERCEPDRATDPLALTTERARTRTTPAVAVEVADSRRRRADPAASFSKESTTGVVQADRAGLLRAESVLEHEARVVREAVVVERPAEETFFAKLRLDSVARRRGRTPRCRSMLRKAASTS